MIVMHLKRIVLVLALGLLLPYSGFSQDVIEDRLIELGVGVSGEIAAVHVEAGHRVKAGDLLLELNPGPYQAVVDSAAAVVRHRELALTMAQEAHERNLELYEEGSLSAVELQSSELTLLQAQSAHAASLEKNIWANAKFSLSRVVAPVDGTIVRRLAHPGERVVAQQRAPVQLVLDPD